MKKDLTAVVVIGDRSGSMTYTINDAIGGFNTYLNDQKKEAGEALFTLVLFDDKYELIHDMVDIQSVKEMTVDIWKPRGLTRLYDAIGKTINDVGDKLSKMKEEERPSKVIFVIITDGDENDSKEFRTHVTIEQMITHQKEQYSWEFIYLAAHMNAVSHANAIGIDLATNYANTGAGNKAAYRSVSYATKSIRDGIKIDNATLGMIANETFEDNDSKNTRTTSRSTNS